MRSFARFVKLELGSPRDNFLAEIDERGDDVFEVQDLGPTAANGEHIGGKARLCRGVTPQLVENYVGRGVALQVDNDSNALAARFVSDVGNALDALVFRGFGDFLDQPGFTDLERDRRQHDRAAFAFAFLDNMPCALHD